MPFPVHAHFWLPADVRAAARDFDAQLGGFLTTEHKDDGTHGALTADSLVVAGATTLHALAATTLATSGNATIGGTLGVTGATTLASLLAGPIVVTGSGNSISALTQDFNAVSVWALDVSGGGRLKITRTADGQVGLSADGSGATIQDLTVVAQISASGLPTSAGGAGTLWVDTAGGLNIVKRV